MLTHWTCLYDPDGFDAVPYSGTPRMQTHSIRSLTGAVVPVNAVIGHDRYIRPNEATTGCSTGIERPTRW